MNNLKVLISVGFLTLLLGCGSDSDGNSNGSSTGSKSDINAAKNLVKEYQKSYGAIYFDKGYIDYATVQNNTRSSANLLAYANAYNVQPERYWAMINVGCILEDGKTQFTQQDQHTQMDLLVGEKSARAVFIQQNAMDNKCYLGRYTINGQLSSNGQVRQQVNTSRGFFPISSDFCQNLIVKQAYVRIPKSEFKSNKENNNPQQNYNNYNRYRNSWNPDEDYYYSLLGRGNNIRFDYSTRAGSSENDSFARTGNGEAVFISETIATNSSGYHCVKNVFWGFEIDPNYPPSVQILGKNDYKL